MKQCLKRLAFTNRFALDIREVDIERSSDDDLTKSQLWDELLEQIRSNQFDVVFMSPPCNTWSRVRFQWQRHPGPRPVRNAVWPLGFPWLNAKQREIVEFANYFVQQTIQACRAAASVGSYFLVEHPEDLGAVGHERPASVWQLDEMRQMVVDTKATTWAVFQCQYGGLSPKPTRFVSNIPHAKSLKYAKWPSFTNVGQYIGPLPSKCGHKWHVKKLIGKSKDGKFQTGPSASYPAGLCKFLAELISSVLRSGENELQPGEDVSTAAVKSVCASSKSVCASSVGIANLTAVTEDAGATAMATDKSDACGDKLDEVSGDQEFPPKPLGLQDTSGREYVGENAGQPIWVEWAGRDRGWFRTLFPQSL